MSRFVGFRLRARGKDADIEQDLKRFADESERIRDAYRLAMAVERGEYIKASGLMTSGAVRLQEQPPKRDERQQLDWSGFPKSPTVLKREVAVKPAPVDMEEEDEILRNLRGSF